MANENSKSLHIFKVGKHIASDGQSTAFSEDDVRKTAEVYDPSKHEAPIVVGHPKENGPAYGWVRSLSFADGDLDATPHQVDPEFAEMVNAGRFRKISASFYLPDSPSNPVPGSFYLRHVGFLGAQPPAVKGLRDPSFSDGEEGVVEFHEPFGQSAIARILRGLRDFLIEKEGKQTADEIIPDYSLRDLEDEATRALTQPVEKVIPSFSEPQKPKIEEPVMTDKTPEQIAAEADALKAREDALAAKEQAIADRERQFAEAEKTRAHEANVAFVETLAGSGRVIPGHKARIVSVLDALEGDATVSFKEGDDDKTESAANALRSFLRDLPNAVSFDEHSRDTGDEDLAGMTATELKEKALEYQEAQKAKGVTVPIDKAVDAVLAGKTA